MCVLNTAARGFDSHMVLSRINGNFIYLFFPPHKLGAAYGQLYVYLDSWRSNSAVRYCADTQQRIVSIQSFTDWKVPGGHCVSNHHVAAQKKGASPLPILFLALISINDNIPARTTWRANPVSVEAWLSGLKRQFAKLVKSFYRLSQVRILLLPLRVAQFTLLSFDRFRLQMKGRRYGHLHASDGDAMLQLHRPSLSEMTLNYT